MYFHTCNLQKIKRSGTAFALFAKNLGSDLWHKLLNTTRWFILISFLIFDPGDSFFENDSALVYISIAKQIHPVANSPITLLTNQ